MTIFTEKTCQQYVDTINCLLKIIGSGEKYDQLNLDLTQRIQKRKSYETKEREDICNMAIAIINDRKTLEGSSCQDYVDSSRTMKNGNAVQSSTITTSSAESSPREVGNFIGQILAYVFIIGLVIWFIRKIIAK